MVDRFMSFCQGKFIDEVLQLASCTEIAWGCTVACTPYWKKMRSCVYEYQMVELVIEFIVGNNQQIIINLCWWRIGELKVPQ
jgi:hypothetical protein